MGNGYALHASETTWGTTPTSGYRALEVNVDGHKTTQEILQHKGLRAARSAPSAAGRRIVKQKATGTIEIPGYSNGLGIFLRAAASTAASTNTGTLSYTQVYEWTTGPPTNAAITTEVYRDRRSGTFDVWTYSGGRVTSLEVGQTLDQMLQLKFAMDYKSAVRQGSAPTRSETEVDPDLIYAWPDATITLTPVGGSGTAECVQSFALTLPNDLDVDDWCLKAGVSEVQTITKGGTWGGGTFTLTVLGVTTAAIAYNATAATIQTAIETAGVPAAYVTATGGPISTTMLSLTYSDTLGDVAAVTINTGSVTGSAPTATVATPTAGVSSSRHEPMRLSAPSPTGTLAWKYQGPAYYDAFVAGTEYALTAVWQGDIGIEADGTIKPSLTIEIPSLFFTGDDPEISPDAATVQNLPFEVTDNGTDPICTVTVVTSDTTY